MGKKIQIFIQMMSQMFGLVWEFVTDGNLPSFSVSSVILIKYFSQYAFLFSDIL